MNEAAASRVLLVRAIESRGFAAWTDADRAGASRDALHAVGAGAGVEAFAEARASAALRRLAVHDPALARWPGVGPWRAEWLWIAAALGLAAGLVVDRIGSTQRINLLAPPVWALIAWNLAVFVWLATARWLPGAARVGALRRALSAAVSRISRRSLPRGTTSSRELWTAFAADWAAFSLPLNLARVTLALHVAAAALALGVIAGMVLRGMVLDYRAGWQSTFLDAGTVHTLLSTLLAPASLLSGIPLPDVAAVQALREPQAGAGASAAPWIHLYSLQLVLCVVLPRAGLALWAARRARRLQQRIALPLDEPYFQRLRLQQRGSRLTIGVVPHAQTPAAAALAALQAMFVRLLGDGVQLQLAPTVPYGAEHEPELAAADGGLRVALFDLGATPEPESQGRLLRSLVAAGTAPPLVLVDESAFVQRFGAGSARLPQRRRGWSELAKSAGCTAVFVDLSAGDATAADAALQAALGSSLRPGGVE